MRLSMRLASALAMLSQLAAPVFLAGQARGGGGSRPHPPGPARRPPPSSIGQPFRPASPFPGLGRGGHRPAPCRSSILGLVLFDPYWWWNADAGVFNDQPSVADAREARPVGGVQLDVDPRRALVYVDGLFAGLVEDFSGYFHHLNATAGVHVIEMVAPEYEPLAVEVLVSPGRTTTYRASLNRTPGRH